MKRLFQTVIFVTATVFLMLPQSALASASTPAFAFNKSSLFLSASGSRYHSSGGLSSVGGNGNYWSAAANSQTNAYNLNFNSGNVNPLNNNNRANGFSVRAVQASNRPDLRFTTMQLSKEELHRLLTLAYLDARKNERNADSQLQFELNLERNLWNLCEDLYSRKWRPLPPVCFIITKPTVREVFAPRFEDRIVSHLLFNMIAPLCERTFIYDSYSCRKGKGTLFGVERFEHHLRAATDNFTHEAFVLNVDISGYFMNINKAILYNILCDSLSKYRIRLADNSKTFDDIIDISFVDYLIRAILFRNPTENCIRVGSIHDWDPLPPHKSLFFSPLGTGLTIGDLTSQLFSNVYMNPFDQFCKRELHLSNYGRYVDDARAIDADRCVLQDCIPLMRDFLHNELKLTLHPNKTNITSTHGENIFLGADCREFRRYAVNRTVASFRSAVHELEYILTDSSSALSIDDYNKALSRLNSYLGYFQHFNERKMLDRTLHDSSLNAVFLFSRNYTKANIRPDIKSLFNSSNYAQINLC